MLGRLVLTHEHSCWAILEPRTMNPIYVYHKSFLPWQREQNRTKLGTEMNKRAKLSLGFYESRPKLRLHETLI